jgi:hypothetical protein
MTVLVPTIGPLDLFVFAAIGAGQQWLHSRRGFNNAGAFGLGLLASLVWFGYAAGWPVGLAHDHLAAWFSAALAYLGSPQLAKVGVGLFLPTNSLDGGRPFAAMFNHGGSNATVTVVPAPPVGDPGAPADPVPGSGG